MAVVRFDDNRTDLSNPISPSSRDRRQSLSSISTGSPSSSPELITPSSSSFKFQLPHYELYPPAKTPGTVHSANSNTNSFPFRRPWQSPVVEDMRSQQPNFYVFIYFAEEEDEAPVVSPKHVRRASTQLAGRFDSPEHHFWSHCFYQESHRRPPSPVFWCPCIHQECQTSKPTAKLGSRYISPVISSTRPSWSCKDTVCYYQCRSSSSSPLSHE